MSDLSLEGSKPCPRTPLKLALNAIVAVFCTLAPHLGAAESVTVSRVEAFDVSQPFQSYWYFDVQAHPSINRDMDLIYNPVAAQQNQGDPIRFTIATFQRIDAFPLGGVSYVYQEDLSLSGCEFPTDPGGDPTTFFLQNAFAVSPDGRWFAMLTDRKPLNLYESDWNNIQENISIFDLQDPQGDCAIVFTETFYAGLGSSLFFTPDSGHLIVGIPYARWADSAWGQTQGKVWDVELDESENWSYSGGPQLFNGLPNFHSSYGYSVAGSTHGNVVAVMNNSARNKESEANLALDQYPDMGHIPENDIRTPSLPGLTIVEGDEVTHFGFSNVSESEYHESARERWTRAGIGEMVDISASGNVAVALHYDYTGYSGPDPTPYGRDFIHTATRSGSGWNMTSQPIDLSVCASLNPDFSYNSSWGIQLSADGKRLALVGWIGSEFGLCLLTRSSGEWVPLTETSAELTLLARENGMTASASRKSIRASADLSRILVQTNSTLFQADLTWQSDIPIGALMLLLQRNSDEEE
jgi:hypothetical protein